MQLLQPIPIMPGPNQCRNTPRFPALWISGTVDFRHRGGRGDRRTRCAQPPACCGDINSELHADAAAGGLTASSSNTRPHGIIREREFHRQPGFSRTRTPRCLFRLYCSTCSWSPLSASGRPLHRLYSARVPDSAGEHGRRRPETGPRGAVWGVPHWSSFRRPMTTLSKRSTSRRPAATSGRYHPGGGAWRRILRRPSTAPFRSGIRPIVRTDGTLANRSR